MLRVSLLYLPPPFRRGVRLEERGEIVRRGRERDLDLESRRETSEYGERVRGRPRTGVRDRDLEGMFVVGSCEGDATIGVEREAFGNSILISGRARDVRGREVNWSRNWLPQEFRRFAVKLVLLANLL